MIADRDYLMQALSLAASYQGMCAPNPAVGAVVVKENQVLSTGVHQGPGHAHAERDALLKLDQSQAKGATLYVTLEPCCHHGRTPACTELIKAYAIKRVVYGITDPNPIVAGKGAAILTKSGIVCEPLQLTPIRQFYRAYCFWHQHQRPWVTAKLALSLDGKIAGNNAEPVAITGTISQQFTHEKRKQSDAIITTARTILQDDPYFTVRLDNSPVMAKPLYVLDRDLSLLNYPHLRITTAARQIVLFHHGQYQPEDVPPCFTPVSIPVVNKQLDWQAMLTYLGQAGVHQAWVEAGGRCFTALYESHYLNEAYLYVNPQCLGSDAYAAFSSPMRFADKALELDWQCMGEDAVCHMIYK